jgi:hypothetical protein
VWARVLLVLAEECLLVFGFFMLCRFSVRDEKLLFEWDVWVVVFAEQVFEAPV